MKLLVLAVVLAFTQAAPQLPKKAGSKAAHESTGREQRTATSGASTQKDDRASPESEAATPRTIDIGKLPDVTLKIGPDWWNRINVVFTGLLVCIGIGGVYYASKSLTAILSQLNAMKSQVSEMQGQRTEMHGQLEAMRGQLQQMKSAGSQAERMIEAASRQVDLMETSGTHTQELAQQAVAQTKLTQTQLELSNRPWISIDAVIPASNLIFDQRGCVLLLGTQLRNVGSSVAKHASIFIEPIVGGVHNPIEVKDRVVRLQKKPVESSFDHGKLIFPNQVVTDQYPIIIPPEILKKALEEGHFKGSNEMTFELFACADYQSTFDPERHHQTHCVYYVARIDRQRGTLMGTFSPSQHSYDLKELVINYKGFGAYAD